MSKRLIDPIYKKYASRVVTAISSTDFYDYFMDVISAGQNTYQFSNRHVEKSVDERWVIAVEDCIKPMEEIINNPRNFIMTEEAIVNVALAKKVTPDTIRHLAQHGDMIDSVTETSVKPNRLMEKFKEDSWNTYENRFVYTLLEMAWDFVDKRYDSIFAALGDECGSHLKLSTDARSLNEHIKAEIDIRIQEEEDLLAADERSESIFARIARCHRILGTFRTTGFAKAMAKFGKIKPPLFPTNAIKKNPNFKACHKLWNFILSYNDIGYKIDIFEQSNEISDEFETDIKNTILFDYVILKNYLQMKEDRVIDTSRAFKKKAIKPTYIKEVIEEIVKNYDLPDVEVKKVLIEEIDKAQLLKLEENERLRLVAEKEKEMKARRLAEEKEARKKAKAEEREKLRQEKERLKELERQEKQQEAEAKKAERAEAKRLEEENLWIEKIKGELGRFEEAIDAKKNQSTVEAAEAKRKEKLALEKQAEKEKKKAAAEKQKEKERIQKEKEKEKAKAKAEKDKEKAKEKAEADKLKARIAAGKTKIVTKIDPTEFEEEEPVKAASAEEERRGLLAAADKSADGTVPEAEAKKPAKKAAKPKAGKPAEPAAPVAEEKPAKKVSKSKAEKTTEPAAAEEERRGLLAAADKSADGTVPGATSKKPAKASKPKAAAPVEAVEPETDISEPLVIPEVIDEEEPEITGPIHVSVTPDAAGEAVVEKVEEPAAAAKSTSQLQELIAKTEADLRKAEEMKAQEAKAEPVRDLFDPTAMGLPDDRPIGEKKPVAVSDFVPDLEEKKGIKGIFRKLFK